jgi:hypothetical protein
VWLLCHTLRNKSIHIMEPRHSRKLTACSPRLFAGIIRIGIAPWDSTLRWYILVQGIGFISQCLRWGGTTNASSLGASNVTDAIFFHCPAVLLTGGIDQR